MPINSLRMEWDEWDGFGLAWIASHRSLEVLALGSQGSAQCPVGHPGRIGPGGRRAGRLAHLEVPGDVGSRQDARGRREEDGKHPEEAAVHAPPVRHQVLGKNVRWKNKA